MHNWPYRILLATVASLMLLLHVWAGKTLPEPVGDEVAFYYPALEFCKTQTLATKHLTNGRPLHWMPPGYPTTLGAWFCLVGPGYASARWLSFAFAVCAFGISISLFRVLKLAPVAFVLLAFAFCSRHAVIMGNFVRMEALLLTLLLLAAHLLWKGRRVAALALVLLSLLIHPNGLYWLLAFPFLAWLAAKRTQASPKPVQWETYLLIATTAALTGYGIYVLTVWPDFWHDWQHQFKTRNIWLGLQLLLFRPDQLAFGVLSLATVVMVERLKPTLAVQTTSNQPGYSALQADYRYLLGVAFVFWLMRILGQGWAYGIFNIVAVTLVAGVFLTLLPALHPLFQKRWAVTLVSATCILALVMGKVYSIPFVPNHYEWMLMRPEQSLPGTGPSSSAYLTDADRKAVTNRLTQLRNRLGRVPKVYTVPEGDGIHLFGTPAGEQIAWHVLSIFGNGALPEYILVHDRPEEQFLRTNIDEVRALFSDSLLPPPFYVRGGHSYHLIDLRGKAPAFLIPQPADR